MQGQQVQTVWVRAALDLVAGASLESDDDIVMTIIAMMIVTLLARHGHRTLASLTRWG